MTLADRARQVADAAPRHQSAAVLRGCADALDAKDVELADLHEEIAVNRKVSTARDREWLDDLAKMRIRADVAEASLVARDTEIDRLRNAAKSRLKCPEGHSPQESRGACWFCDAERNAADLAAERRGQGFEELLANVEDEWNSLHDYLQPPCQCPSCKGAQRHDYSRGTPADGHWDMAAQWAHDIRVHVDTLRADLAALRAVVRELPGHKHGIVGKVGCEKLFEGGPDWLVLKCICGADESNAALAAAKKMAGGE